MPEVRRRVLYCSIVLVLVAVTSCLFGVVYFIAAKPMPYHLEFIGMSLEEIEAFNPKLTAFLSRFIRMLAAVWFGLGILIAGITLQAFRRAQRWAWVTIFAALSVTLTDMLLASLFFDAPVKWITIALYLLFLTAMFIPIRDFFGRRSSRDLL